MDTFSSMRESTVGRVAVSTFVFTGVSSLSLLAGKLAKLKPAFYLPVGTVASLGASGLTFWLMTPSHGRPSSSGSKERSEQVKRIDRATQSVRQSSRSSTDDTETSPATTESLPGKTMPTVKGARRAKLLRGMTSPKNRHICLWGWIDIINRLDAEDPNVAREREALASYLIPKARSSEELSFLTCRPNTCGADLSTEDCEALVWALGDQEELLEKLLDEFLKSPGLEKKLVKSIFRNGPLFDGLAPFLDPDRVGRDAALKNLKAIAYRSDFEEEIHGASVREAIDQTADRSFLKALMELPRRDLKEFAAMRLCSMDLGLEPGEHTCMESLAESVTLGASLITEALGTNVLGQNVKEYQLRADHFMVLSRHLMSRSDELSATFADVLDDKGQLKRRVHNILCLFKSLGQWDGTEDNLLCSEKSVKELCVQDLLAAPALLKALGDELPKMGSSRKALALIKANKVHEAFFLCASPVTELLKGGSLLPAGELSQEEYRPFFEERFPEWGPDWAEDEVRCAQAEEAFCLAMAFKKKWLQYVPDELLLREKALSAEQLLTLIKTDLDPSEVKHKDFIRLKETKPTIEPRKLVQWLFETSNSVKAFLNQVGASDLDAYFTLVLEQATPAQLVSLWRQDPPGSYAYGKGPSCFGHALSSPQMRLLLGALKERCDRGITDDELSALVNEYNQEHHNSGYSNALEAMVLCLSADQLARFKEKSALAPKGVAALAKALESEDAASCVDFLMEKGGTGYSPMAVRLILERPEAVPKAVRHLVALNRPWDWAAGPYLLGQLLEEESAVDAVEMEIRAVVTDYAEDPKQMVKKLSPYAKDPSVLKRSLSIGTLFQLRYDLQDTLKSWQKGLKRRYEGDEERYEARSAKIDRLVKLLAKD